VHDLVVLAEALGRRPGFFLDEDDVDELPSGTVVVDPLWHGESLAIRLAPEDLPDAVRRRGGDFVYHRAPDEMGYGVIANDLIVACALDEPATVGQAYLVDLPNGTPELLVCNASNAGRAVFTTSDGNSRIASARRKHGGRNYYLLVAVLRLGLHASLKTPA